MHLGHMHDCGERERACRNCDYSRTLRRLGYIWNRCLARKFFRKLITGHGALCELRTLRGRKNLDTRVQAKIHSRCELDADGVRLFLPRDEGAE